jgi:UDP-3-O-[3-hydroxymyristoyl] glucosamine N-acyltransferase
LILSELAARLECRLEGDGAIEIHRVAAIEKAEPGDLTFFANPRYGAALKATRASAVIASDGAPQAPCAVLRSPNPYLTFARAVALLTPSVDVAPGVDATAVVSSDAVLHPGVSVGPLVVIGGGARGGARTRVLAGVTIGAGAEIGEDCVIHARVSIRERVRLGNRVVVQDGAVIGSDGFGFARRPDGTHEKIPQAGGVVIEDDVEIGANTTIDRPALGETRIGSGTKIDNLVQIAHGVSIGRNSLLAAQVGIAGSTTLGDGVTLAGQVGVAGHIHIGDGVVATAQTGIPNSVGDREFISGYPAIPNRQWLKASVLFQKLPELHRTLSDLQARLEALEQRIRTESQG